MTPPTIQEWKEEWRKVLIEAVLAAKRAKAKAAVEKGLQVLPALFPGWPGGWMTQAQADADIDQMSATDLDDIAQRSIAYFPEAA